MVPDLIQLAVLVVFTINALLLTSLILFKVVHRRRMHRHETRRKAYVTLLSRHLVSKEVTEPITGEMADDPAFLDALIDMRNAVAGDDTSTLHGIVDSHGVIERQMRYLDSSLLLGRKLRAAVAMAEVGDERSANTLLAHLDDREPEIRIQCARGLGRIQWTPAIDEIVSRFSHEVPWVRARFSDTLVGYGTKATWPLLAYIRINHCFDEKGPALALRTIAQIQDDQAVRPLLEILQDASNPEIEIATIEALGEIGSPEALPYIDPYLDSSRWELRAKTATGLGGLGSAAAIPRLRTALRDGNWSVRRSAAAAVARLPGGVQSLYKSLEDEDPFAVDSAAEALLDAGEHLSPGRREKETGSDGHLLTHMKLGTQP